MTDPQKIRNFAILAHIDHGKSTLADRFLELTGTVPKEKMRDQLLDQMELEREKGITIKLQPVRMEYKGYVLNLIDTPGHMDFYSEVERSLQAVEGVVLLVDGLKGVQAQTLSNLELIRKQNLAIIPVVNKIDLTNARTEEVANELRLLLGVDMAKIIKVSAKYGTNVEQLLDEIIKNVPGPKGSADAPLKTMIFDAFFEPYKGIIAFIRVLEGVLKKEGPVRNVSRSDAGGKEIGVFKPEMRPVAQLGPGEIGYVATGQKNLEDFWEELGIKKPQPMLFCALYPQEESDFALLKEALLKLKLNDFALYFEPVFSDSLGRGFKAGFLGKLHFEIALERLRREYGLEPVLTRPQVVFDISLTEKTVREPWVKLKIITPQVYFNSVMKLIAKLRGECQRTDSMTNERVVIEVETPLSDIIVDFYDKLKTVSSGFASMSYQPCGMRPGDLIRLDVLLNKTAMPALSQIVPREGFLERAKKISSMLKELLPRQNFPVPIQVCESSLFAKEPGTKIIARETVPARRKDVLAPLYGGDITRKMKLLEKQKKGKKRLQAKGRVNISHDVFLKLLKQDW
jgi:GTP-binding protein LepA